MNESPNSAPGSALASSVGPWVTEGVRIHPAPLSGYPLPDEAYTDHPEHIACILPAIMISPDWLSPTRASGMLPIGTRWQCPDCEAIHVVVAASPTRTWQLEQP